MLSTISKMGFINLTSQNMNFNDEKRLEEAILGVQQKYAGVASLAHSQDRQDTMLTDINILLSAIDELNANRKMYRDGYYKLRDKPMRSVPICPVCKYECDLWHTDDFQEEGLTCKRCDKSFDMIYAEWAYCDPDVFSFMADKDELIKKSRVAMEEIKKGPNEPEINLSGDYNQGLMCGVEDVGHQKDGYSACVYGFEVARDRVTDWAAGIAESFLKIKQ